MCTTTTATNNNNYYHYWLIFCCEWPHLVLICLFLCGVEVTNVCDMALFSFDLPAQ